jgi:hypothetical protein
VVLGEKLLLDFQRVRFHGRRLQIRLHAAGDDRIVETGSAMCNCAVGLKLEKFMRVARARGRKQPLTP